MDLIRLIRLQAGKVKDEGSTSVTISSLESLLSEAERHLTTTALIDPSVVLEHAKMEHASNLAEYSAKSAASLELFKSVIETAKVAIQSLIWINGGAAVALLAFIGHLATAPNARGVPIGSFALPLLCFVIGVWSAALFAGFVSLAQKLYAERWPRCGKASVVASIIFGLSSLACFGLGSFFGYGVFAGM